MKKTCILLLHLLLVCHAQAEDGYELWLRYQPVSNKSTLQSYTQQIQSVYLPGNTSTITIIKKELLLALKGMLGRNIPFSTHPNANGMLVIGNLKSIRASGIDTSSLISEKGSETFLLKTTTLSGKKIILVTARTDAGVLYGVFHFLRLMQTGAPLANIHIESAPRISRRILNHWDNLDRHVERGYAGISLWNWHTLPAYIDQRYIDYARACASIGINGTVLTNVNANALVLTAPYLEKVKALANTFRPYGIRVYLTARFSAPVEIGKLRTADPLNDTVRRWWKEKVDEIYKLIPDFGGFLVKANSEGQPGPQFYGRNHADGANMMADALSPHDGIVMWRAFVYSPESNDRFSQAYDEFKPLDGLFRNNVMVQVKNGPIDFQPREPFSPLFGAMPRTALALEFQLTQEYLGQGTHLVYQAPLYKEVLEADTYAKGKGSTIAKVIDGNLYQHTLSAIAGVANTGNERNWTGHLFGQANWYTFGRLAWDHTLSSEQIAQEWILQTFNNSSLLLATVKKIMLVSHETMVNYMTPLGLHHIMGNGHHYGPAPWSDNLPRPDWNPVYYHKADSLGVGFDRTSAGSKALQQYQPDVRKQFDPLAACDEKYLLWFHHVPWRYKMKSGRTLWEELGLHYQAGVDSARGMQRDWNKLKGLVDEERFEHVKMLLAIQAEDAAWWRDACLLYFQGFAKMPLPNGVEQPAHSLEYYKQLRFPYAPGN